MWLESKYWNIYIVWKKLIPNSIYIKPYWFYYFTIPEIYLFDHPSKSGSLYLVAWHAAVVFAENPCNPHKCSLTGFLHHWTKAWWNRNSIWDPRLNIIIVEINNYQYITYYQSTSKIYCLWLGLEISLNWSAARGGRCWLVNLTFDNRA